MTPSAAPLERRQSVPVPVGHVNVGGGAPIVVQSMTNTDTADVNGTAQQVAALARAGSEIVRITVDRDEAAAAVPHIKDKLLKMGVNVPLVGDFHYIGHKLLAAHPACAEALDKYRINPGNVGFGNKKDAQFSAIVETAIKHDKPVRIGATFRISLTAEPGGDRTVEVKVAQEILQTMGFRVFVPLVAACPGCGRTTSTTFQELARDIQGFIHDSMPAWKTQYPGVESLNVAVMGCIVNGPGESKHADIGISLPGTGEQPAAPVFIDGKKAVTLRGPTVAADFKKMVIDYIERRYGAGARQTAAE